MQKLIQLLFLSTICLILFQSFSTDFGKRDGTEPGFTGSPGDSLKTCVVCHGGVAITVSNWITSTVPATGFVPGERYTITATNTAQGHNRFGFSVSPQDISGNLLGTIIITDTTQTKTVGNEKYVTYRSAGVDGKDEKSWSFDWVAPDVNEVVFYGAFNSNHDGHKGSDVTYLSQLKLFKEGFTSLPSLSIQNRFNVYPNPASETIRVESTDIPIQKIKIVNILNKLTFETTNINYPIEVVNWPNGTYLIEVTFANHRTETSKWVKF
ncbi:MAG: T9SS type A sorting domain-containing protein [Bacteroidia bacterium]|nr:T9SS type A sorting domain-containing protein [Bacteroidia bacterium]